jgi:hypothetical protein
MIRLMHINKMISYTACPAPMLKVTLYDETLILSKKYFFIYSY